MGVGTWWVIVGISLASAGFYGTKGPFWAIPSIYLTGPAAAAGIAWINSLGNLGGSFGPAIVGLAKNATGTFAAGFYAMALCCLASAFISLFWLRIPRQPVAGQAIPVPAQ